MAPCYHVGLCPSHRCSCFSWAPPLCHTRGLCKATLWVSVHCCGDNFYAAGFVVSGTVTTAGLNSVFSREQGALYQRGKRRESAPTILRMGRSGPASVLDHGLSPCISPDSLGESNLKWKSSTRYIDDLDKAWSYILSRNAWVCSSGTLTSRKRQHTLFIF